MTVFLLAASALTALSLLALAPALLAGPAVPRARRTSLALLLLVPLLAASLYHRLGTPAALDAAATAAPVNPIEQMVQRLADRLHRTPDDADGWALLARAYEQLNRPELALPAYQHLERLRPNDAQVLSQHAVTLAVVNGQGLTGEPEALLRRALALDPEHVPALALLAVAAQERGDGGAARALWVRTLEAAPPDGDVADQARKALRELGVRR